ESGRGPLPVPSSRNAALNGSRRSCAAYSKVSNCCMTGSGSSGGAGRAFTLATHSSRFGASPGVLVTPLTQPASASASTQAAIPALFDVLPMSASPPRRSSRLRVRRLLLVEVAVGLDRAGELQARIGPQARG